MRFTVAIVCLLGITSSYAIKVTKDLNEPKEKREAAVAYPSSGHATHTLQIQPSHDSGNAISIGAGYSIGGKPSFSYEGQQGGQYHIAQQPQQTIQLAPITLQPEQANFASGSDLSQLMSQLTHGLQTGEISLQQAEPSHQFGAQDIALPQYTYGEPKLQQYSISEQAQSSPPSYAAGTKGLGSYGSTGPVLFNPSDSHGQTAFNYAVPSLGQSFDESSYPGLTIGQPIGHSSGHSLSGSGYSAGSGHGHALGNGILLGGHSFGGAGSGHYSGLAPGKSIGSPYVKSLSFAAPSKNSFKPSAFIGASVGDGQLSGISGPFGTVPSFANPSVHGALAISTGHAPNFGNSLAGVGGSPKYSFAPAKAESYSGSFDSNPAYAAAAAHTISPPRTTYGSPSGSFSLSSGSGHGQGNHAAHAASNSQYYVSPSKIPSSSFVESNSAYRGPAKSHSSISLGTKFSHGHTNRGHGFNAGSPHYAPKDIQGSYSENTYNTIKYSEELKPRSK